VSAPGRALLSTPTLRCPYLYTHAPSASLNLLWTPLRFPCPSACYSCWSHLPFLAAFFIQRIEDLLVRQSSAPITAAPPPRHKRHLRSIGAATPCFNTSLWAILRRAFWRLGCNTAFRDTDSHFSCFLTLLTHGQRRELRNSCCCSTRPLPHSASSTRQCPCRHPRMYLY